MTEYKKKNIAAVATALILIAAGMAAYGSSIQDHVVSTATVTQTVYPTTTTVVTVTGAGGVTTQTNTITEQPIQTLSTTTVSGTQTYTATSTQTVAGTTSTTTTSTTSTISTLLYQPFAMYYTATTDNPFYSQVTPIVYTAPNGNSFSETIGGGTMSMTLAATGYQDLGFSYDFGTLGWFATHSLTITGSGFANNLWLNNQDWTWTPNGLGGSQYVSQGTDGIYGLGSTTGTTTISGTTSYFIAGQGSSITGCTGNTYTITQLIGGACAGISGSTPFSIWVGIDSSSVGTTTATVTQISSTPYP